MKRKISCFLLSIVLIVALLANGASTVAYARPSSSRLELGFTPTHMIMHPTENILYASNILERYIAEINLDTNEIKKLKFTYSPERLYFQNNTLYVATLLRPHAFYNPSADIGMITLVDPESFTVKKEIETTISPFDLAVDMHNTIYVTSGSNQHSYIKSYSSDTGKEISSTSSYMEHRIALHPSQNRLYTVSTSISPRDNYRVDINGDKLTTQFDSPYHGDYSMDPMMKISPDGKFIFNYSGTIFNSNVIKSHDMKYLHKLKERYNDITFNLDNNEFFIGTEDGTLTSYDYKTFKETGKYQFDRSIKYLFNRDNKITAVLADNNENYSIKTIDSSSIQEIDVDNTIKIQGLMTKPVYNESKNEAYILDKAFNKLYILDVLKNAFKEEIDLPFSPSAACLSEDLTKLYIANNDSDFIASEYTFETGKFRHIEYSVPLDDFEFGYKQIYNINNKLYIVTGDSNLKLYLFDSKTLNPFYYTDMNGSSLKNIGNIAFSSDNQYMYTSKQSFWEYGDDNSGISKYKIEKNKFIKVDEYSPSYNEMQKHPIGSPIVLDETSGVLYYKNRIFSINNLNSNNIAFPEEMFAMNSSNTVSAGLKGITLIKHGLYGKFPDDFNMIPSFFNKDGILYMYDNNSLISVWPLIGDMNGDTKVDILDLSAMSVSYGKKYEDSKYNFLHDLNSDKIIDIYDLVTLAKLLPESTKSKVLNNDLNYTKFPNLNGFK